MDKKMKISRIIVVLLTIISFSVMFIDEDISWKIMPFILGLIAYIFSFVSSKKTIKILGRLKKIKNIIIKIMYLFILQPIKIIVLSVGVYALALGIAEIVPASELSLTVIFLFGVWAGITCILVPFIQIIVILLLNIFIKEK